MSKKQAKLDSFFGAPTGAKTKKKNPQTKLDSFFGKSRSSEEEKENKKRPNDAVEAEDKIAELKSKANDKSNDNQNYDMDAHMETTDGANNQATTKRAKKSKISIDVKRRRRVIEDDSDSDEEKTDAASSVAKKNLEATMTESNNTPPTKTATIKTEVPKNSSKGEASDKNSDKEPSQSNASESDSQTKKPTSKSLTKEKTTATMSKAKAQTDKASPSSSSLPYGELCEAFEKIEAISSRLQIQEILTNLFRKQITSGTPENIYPMMYLCSSSVAPAYECVELGIGDAILMKAIAEAYGTSMEFVKEKVKELGDLGQAAQTFKGKQRTLGGFFTSKSAAKKVLGCQEILTTFREIANMKGNQSQKWKTEKIKKMLVGATNTSEAKYIIRALQGKLRIGLAQSTVLVSLAHALALSVPPKAAEKEAKYATKKEALAEADDSVEAKEYCNKKLPKEKRLEYAVAIVKKAYSEVPSFDALVDAVLSVPLQELHRVCTLTPGIPVEPMLAKPTKSIQEVLKRLEGQEFTAEFKYDGERAQIHMLPDGTTKVFSRNLLDTSEKFPEVPLFVREAAGSEVKSCVCDAEVVAYDAQNETLVPFQILSTRKKTEESAETAKVQVIVQAFDLMYLNGESLLGRTLRERRELLKKHFSVVPGKFKFAVALDHHEDGDTAVLEEFLEQAIKGQCEGLMVKTLDSNAMYEPSRRSLNWLKLKKDYLDGLGDSVDLVPIGAYYGKGKRTGVYGAYLLACYDPDTEEFQSVCKIGTGFSDENLKSLAEGLNKHTIPQKTSQYIVTDQLKCDVWFDCVQVWEVKAADLSKSSAHRGALGKTGEEGRGIGLRFPRFERLRNDKRPEEATTSDQILEMYYNQDSIAGGNGNGDDDDDGI